MVDDALDVVTQLAAHQSNLTPPDYARRAAIVALPTPAIVRALAGDALSPLRRRWLDAWCARLGGGDGPLPLVDLDGDDRCLDVVLHELADAGVERLFLLGARDQPGFAREVTCRWPHALATADAAGLACDLPCDLACDLPCDLAAPLYDGRATRRLVADGPLLVAVADDADPSVVAASAGAIAYAHDPARAAGAGHGFLPPSALFATDAGNRLRDDWRRYWTARGHAADVRDAALGLDGGLERRLRDASARPPRDESRRARLFAVTGLDGSGKSSHVAALRDALVAGGRRTAVLKLYRQGAFLELADELGARTRRGAALASFRVSRIVKLVDSLRVHRDQLRPALDDCDAIVLDRYTETHVAAAAQQLGWDLTGHPLLAPFPAADRAFWLDLDPAVAVVRLRARGTRLTADEHAIGLHGYARAFAALATTPIDLVLDAAAPFADNAAAIASGALAVPSPVRAQPNAYAGAAASTVARRDERLPVHVGADGGCVLGADVPALAAHLRREIGRAADAVPAALWVEAYAAQLVLDARTTTAPVAALPIWPGALRRMPTFADLHVLDELARLCEAAVYVERVLPGDGAPLWDLIAPAPAARRRLAAEYGRALAAIVDERGWRDAPPSRDVARVA